MPPPDPRPHVLTANLAALGRRHPALAQTLRDTPPLELDWSAARNGQPCASLPPTDATPRPLALASRYDPAAEADKLLAPVDFAQTACVALLGLGLGYAAEAALAGLGDSGLLVVYEPDLPQLAAVLAGRDLTALLARPNLVLLAGPDVDRAAQLQHLERSAGLLTQGTQLVTLPPTRQRHPEAVQRFGRDLADVLAFCRTNIATALVNASRTCRNLADNLDVYAAGATTDPLRGLAQGRPAVCVGAGPSLVKNVDLLRDPAVRSRVILIAVQTTLKPLLDRGIRPDFVTALDYSPICARFYEGLPDLPDVTLVAEPKANAAILDAFPGPVRVTQNNFSDTLLGHPHEPGLADAVPGGGLARPIVPIKAGATVAHLSYYLARHLGCDPVIFIGQDLGFSDGLYYAPGTAVHQVWDCELGEFNTIETMEWQRVARMRGHLRKFDDIHGRPIYSDEQMTTYLKQFERDFADAQSAGLTVIDATEGGMVKQHVQPMTLAQALADHATQPLPAVPLPPPALDPDRLRRLGSLLDHRLTQVRELARVSRESLGLIRQMIRCCETGQTAKLNKLFPRLDRHRARVDTDLKPPFTLVSQLNAMGTFRRSRADRQLGRAHAAADASTTAGKLRTLTGQLHRDADNIDWIIQACDEALSILAGARARLDRRHGSQPAKPDPVETGTTAASTATAA